MTTRAIGRRGMNMRDMKHRSMASHRLDGISHSGQQLRDESSPIEGSDTEDPFEPSVHVDQGDGTFTASRPYDGGGEDDYATLPDSPPDGWWD